MGTAAVKKRLSPAQKAGLTREAKQLLGKRVDRIAASWEKRFADEAERQLKRDQAALVKILRKVPEMGGVEETGAEGAAETKQGIDWQTVEKSWQWYFEQAGDRWREAFVPLLQGVIVNQAENWKPFFERVAVGMEFDVVNTFALQAYDDYLITFAQPIMETTNLDTVALLQTAMAQGWGIPEMEKAVGTLFKTYLEPGTWAQLSDEEKRWFQDRLPKYRLENISRTETLKASNFGNLQVFKGYGAPMKEWLATLDDRTRPDHLDAMMRYSEGGKPGPIPIDEYFIVGGVRMMYPGDGPPEQSCNCRCTVLPFSQIWAQL